MKILVVADDVDLSILAEVAVSLAVDSDRKGFYVEKHRFLPITGSHRHMSELKHILLAGSQDGQDDSR